MRSDLNTGWSHKAFIRWSHGLVIVVRLEPMGQGKKSISSTRKPCGQKSTAVITDLFYVKFLNVFVDFEVGV